MNATFRAGLARLALLVPALAAAAGPAGCGRDDEAAGGGGFAMPPMPVRTAPARQQMVENRYSVVGTVSADDEITVVAEIGGRVVALPFREGEPIARGALIAQLDDAELAAEVARAEAVVGQRQSSFRRIDAIAAQGAGTPQDLDDARAALAVAEAELALARARLAKTRITAPFAGIAGARRISVGAYLDAGDAITDLARIDELRVNFTAPERLLPRLVKGAPVTIRTSSYPDRSLAGQVDVIDPTLDPDTRAAQIIAHVDNAERLLRPGMSADVSVVLEARPEAITIPAEAVFVQAGQAMVYVVQPDSTVAPRPVALGLREPDTVEVVEGLAAGEQVVSEGHQKLFPGARVMPLPAGAQGGPGGSPAPGDAPADSAAAPPGEADGRAPAEVGA